MRDEFFFSTFGSLFQELGDAYGPSRHSSTFEKGKVRLNQQDKDNPGRITSLEMDLPGIARENIEVKMTGDVYRSLKITWTDRSGAKKEQSSYLGSAETVSKVIYKDGLLVIYLEPVPPKETQFTIE
jgi:HSP20 family molecular chaperone IbpA